MTVKHPDFQTHLALLPTCEWKMLLTMLVGPAPPRHRVKDNGVDIITIVETGVEVQGDVLMVVTNVDGKAVNRGKNTELRKKNQYKENVEQHFGTISQKNPLNFKPHIQSTKNDY